MDQRKSNFISFSLQHERPEILHRPDELEDKLNGQEHLSGHILLKCYFLRNTNIKDTTLAALVRICSTKML